MAKSKTYTESQRFAILKDAATIGMAPAAKKAGMAGDATIRSWIAMYPEQWQSELSTAIKSSDDPKAPARRLAAAYNVSPETGDISSPWKPGAAKKSAKKAAKKAAKTPAKKAAPAKAEEPKKARIVSVKPPEVPKFPPFIYPQSEGAPQSERPLLERIRDLEAQVARLTALIG